MREQSGWNEIRAAVHTATAVRVVANSGAGPAQAKGASFYEAYSAVTRSSPSICNALYPAFRYTVLRCARSLCYISLCYIVALGRFLFAYLILVHWSHSRSSSFAPSQKKHGHPQDAGAVAAAIAR